MSKKERKETLEMAIWINLVIGIYNLFIFTNMDSYFHLILGSLNIAVWVFNRDKLSSTNIHWIGNKVEHKRK
jgi:hypothetical protein|tara:strand:+ start:5600 stop:5815 length:216 start_codon:yes stop_codon:yes gene_type:complete